jgi:hypothetical protein
MQKKLVKKGKWWFRGVKRLMTGRYKQPNFVFLGDEFVDGSIILSNHEGTDAPMSLEMYLDRKIRFWGANEMNSGLVKMYKYQTRVYYCEKKHWNLHLARLFCLLATPLTNMFYKGLNLISTYKDGRFYKTVKESYAAIEKGDSIVIFPENSEKGYLAELEGFFGGFIVLAEYALKKGKDLPIVVSYFRKKEKVYVFDKPIMFSELLEKYESKEEILNALLDRCNLLGKIKIESKGVEENKISA